MPHTRERALSIVAAALIFAGCGGLISTGNKPGDRVKEFVNLAAKQDYAGMKRIMPPGNQAESTIRGDSDLMLFAGTEGVKDISILTENTTGSSATVDARITYGASQQPLIYRFQLQQAPDIWFVVRWERMTNSR